jgi:hypothetical protein
MDDCTIKSSIFSGMNYSVGIPLLLCLLLTLSGCGRKEKGIPNEGRGAAPVESTGISPLEEDPPKDSILQVYAADEYSIQVHVTAIGSEYLPMPETMWMTIHNRSGTKTYPAEEWYLDLEEGVIPLEPEWPDHFLVHEYNTGNCCTCDAFYLLKVTGDEIRFIGLVNHYKEGKFYVNICDWPPGKSHAEMTLTEHEVPLLNDTLHYPPNWNM